MNLSHALLFGACVSLMACSKSPTPSEPVSVPNPATAAPSEAGTPMAPPPATSAGEPQPATPAPAATDNASTNPPADANEKKESTQDDTAPKK